MAISNKTVFNVNLDNSFLPGGSDLPSNGWDTNEILGSPELNLYMGQASNWAGDYKSLSSITTAVISIPDIGVANFQFNFYTLTSTSGTAVTIDLTQYNPGQIITLYNPVNALSSFVTTNAGSTPKTIFEGEYIRLMVTNDGTQNQCFIINDAESVTCVPIASITDLMILDANITAAWESRGWISLIGNCLVGNTGSYAQYLGPQYLTLFTKLWNNCPGMQIFNSSGSITTRGVSAAADWAALKSLAIIPSEPNALNFVLGQYSNGSAVGLTSPGLAIGSNSFLLSYNNIPQISPTYNGSSTISPTYNGSSTISPSYGSVGPNPITPTYEGLLAFSQTGNRNQDDTGHYGGFELSAGNSQSYVTTITGNLAPEQTVNAFQLPGLNNIDLFSNNLPPINSFSLPPINSFGLPPINSFGSLTPAAISSFQPTLAVGRMMRAF